MNPFVVSQTDSRPSVRGWLWARPGAIVFTLSLAVGLAAVGWHAAARARGAREFARLQTQARGASLQLRLRHAVSAVQALGALARQSGGSIPNFQGLGSDLLASWPDLATLELQPGGVVNDIVPRAGYERALGFNVLKDPVQGPGALASIQRRTLTVSGPLRLYRAEQGLVVRAPVFQRARDGRERFWGFVAALMRLTEPLAGARLDELQEAVQKELGAGSARPGPAAAPLGAWIDKARVGVECFGVLLAAGLLWLVARLIQSGHSLEGALAEANRNLAGAAAERKQAQEEWRASKQSAAAAQNQLKEARAALLLAESKGAQTQARLEAAEQANRQACGALQARLEQAEAHANELRDRLDDAVRAAGEAARVAQAELGEMRAALEQARQTVVELQSRLDASIRAENVAAAQAALAGAAAQGAEQTTSQGGATALPAVVAETQAPPAVPVLAETQPAPAPVPVAVADSPLPAGEAVRPDTACEVGPPSVAAALNGADAQDGSAAEPPAQVPAQMPAPEKPRAVAPLRRKKARRHTTPDLFGAQSETEQTPAAPPENGPEADRAEVKAAERASPEGEAEEPNAPADTGRARPLKSAVDPAQLRKAVGQILPLLAGQDPGARDCLKDNRALFQAAFTPEGYAEFEQSVKKRDFAAAQEHLKKAAKRHGLAL